MIETNHRESIIVNKLYKFRTIKCLSTLYLPVHGLG